MSFKQVISVECRLRRGVATYTAYGRAARGRKYIIARVSTPAANQVEFMKGGGLEELYTVPLVEPART